jgi:basic amino acid/polyamine antiporter, APA family
MPGNLGVVLIVIAAVTAFASTGNAGILTASRYPLAMARDRLLWAGFDRLGRFGTPTLAVVVTSVLMILAIVFLDVERLASLGSAFLLLLFALINLSVILMRESRLASYAPGYRSPLYPWMQIAGVVTTFGLIFTLGPFYVVFILVIIVLAWLWFRFYVRDRVPRRGADLRAVPAHRGTARRGRRRRAVVDPAGARRERGRLVRRADRPRTDRGVRPAGGALPGHAVGGRGLDEMVALTAEDLVERLEIAFARGIVPERSPAAVFDVLLPGLDHSQVVLVRAKQGCGSLGLAASPAPGRPARRRRVRQRHGTAVPRLPRGARSPSTCACSLSWCRWSRSEASPARGCVRRSDQELLETLMRDERFASSWSATRVRRRDGRQAAEGAHLPRQHAGRDGPTW